MDHAAVMMLTNAMNHITMNIDKRFMCWVRGKLRLLPFRQARHKNFAVMKVLIMMKRGEDYQDPWFLASYDPITAQVGFLLNFSVKCFSKLFSRILSALDFRDFYNTTRVYNFLKHFPNLLFGRILQLIRLRIQWVARKANLLLEGRRLDDDSFRTRWWEYIPILFRILRYVERHRNLRGMRTFG